MAALLLELVVFLLGVPLEGSPGAAAMVLGLVLVGSVGLGFIISLLSPNDTQAVQYAMIVLLASLFFGGSFLATERLGTRPTSSAGCCPPRSVSACCAT